MCTYPIGSYLDCTLYAFAWQQVSFFSYLLSNKQLQSGTLIHRVVSGSRDATLRVWDIEQGTCMRVLVGHLAAVRCVQYDGKLIVSGAYDYMVKIWHPERSECLHTLQGHTNRVYSLQVS